MSCTTQKSTLNFKVVSGDTITRTLTFTNSDGTNYDISIYTSIKMEVRKNSGETVVASAELGSGFEFDLVENNILHMSVQMPELTGLYKYDIEFSTATTNETLIRGQITLLEQITE